MTQTERESSPTLVELRERIAELERERQLLNAIANTAPSLLCVVDAEGRVRPYASNKAFEATLGYEPAETGGVLFWERYVPPEDAADVRAAIEEAIAAGHAVQRDGRWIARDGRVVHVAWSCHPLPMIASGPIFLVAAADVTARKLHEDEVRRSRARIVAAADEARRRLERDLHDGAQQRLIALLLSLRIARSKQAEGSDARAGFDGAIEELSAALEELRELARGIHPAALTQRGLAAALSPVAARAPLPVTLDVPELRFGEQVEGVVYYVVSEALANVARHARATAAAVRVEVDGERLRVEIEDDGVGAADASSGTGLRGLADRVAALDGTFSVESPPGGGTRVCAEIPLG